MLNFSSSYSPAYSVRARNAKSTIITSPTYSFTQKTTTVSYPWPPTINGVERIALSAQGDLQRVLSAYFARPISIVVVYENTQWQRSPHTPPEPLRQPNTKAIASASVETPIIQTRQVHLQCSGKVVCVATSTIRITSPNVAHLFLVDKYAIGQTFRRLDKLPVFELLSVGLGSYYLQFDASLAANKVKSDATSASPSDQCKELWRRYKLTVPGFDCDIVEVFPDREMFNHGEAWLDDRVVVAGSPRLERPGAVTVFQRRAPWLASTSNKSLLLTLGFFLVLAYELTSLVMG